MRHLGFDPDTPMASSTACCICGCFDPDTPMASSTACCICGFDYTYLEILFIILGHLQYSENTAIFDRKYQCLT
jgi:hypothetical protein